MGIITLEKANHLYWLGRYAERITGTVRMFFQTYDRMIDVDPKCYTDFCERLSIPSDIYEDDFDFAERFIYDVNNPDSVVSCITHAYDNAVVLREEISSNTLAYIDITKRILEKGKDDRGTLILELKNVLDYINAFWGSANDTVEGACLSIIKEGKHAEKLDIQYRFDIRNKEMERELAKLIYRTTSLHETYHFKGLDRIAIELKENCVTAEDYIGKIKELTDCFKIPID